MSKTMPRARRSRRRGRIEKRKSPAPENRKKQLAIVGYAIIAILAAVPFAMGKYFEFNYPDPYDSGGYVYSAKHILEGAEIGAEEKPSAKLATLLVNMLGVWLFQDFSETGPKFMQMVFQAAALILMFVAVRKLFGTLSAAVAVIIASVYVSAPVIAKFGNVKEQHMIAFMVIGVSCFVLRQLDGKWWWAVLAGAFLSWAPLFKETGTSAIGAVGMFVIAQPVLKHRTYKQTGVDILLLLAGAALALGPLYIWIIGWDVQLSVPYEFVFKTIGKMLPAKGAAAAAPSGTDYVGGSRKLVTFAEQWPRVLRFYGVLILPIALALSSIIARLAKGIYSRRKKAAADLRTSYDRFVLLLAVWWILDMAFVWISPRSYEQYYLPLNASAAMLGGYLIVMYHGRLRRKPVGPTTGSIATRDMLFVAVWAIAAWAIVHVVFVKLIDTQEPRRYGQYRMVTAAAVIMLGLGVIALLRDRFSKGLSTFRWTLVGLVAMVCMVVMSWHIFFGITTSPHSGQRYPDKRHGYAQRLDEISARLRNDGKGPWERVGEYIRNNSEPTDKIYVWGWYPGIYICAQRFSSASKAFMMPRPAPQALANSVATLLAEFEKEPPKFIVDSRKRHIPTNRPPYELWPIAPKGFMGITRTWFLPPDERVTGPYDQQWSADLRQRFGDDEADRYTALAPLRKFVMDKYQIVLRDQYFPVQGGWPWLIHKAFGTHTVFELKDSTTSGGHQ